MALEPARSEDTVSIAAVERDAALAAIKDMWGRTRQGPSNEDKAVCISIRLAVNPENFGRYESPAEETLAELAPAFGPRHQVLGASSCRIRGPITLDSSGQPAILLTYDSAEVFVSEALTLGHESAPQWRPRDGLNLNRKIDPKNSWFVVNYMTSDGTLKFDGTGEVRVGARSDYYYYDFAQVDGRPTIKARYHEASIE
jgi:hypothetical protein